MTTLDVMIKLPHEVSIVIVLFGMFALPTAVLIVGAIRSRKEKRQGR
ncbi:hypothetical protein [Amycolatopsis nalaikhensis]|uniref:Uncharacterized protein n=1 Tax=Amycolatopsis nalaikhensis TaxID=715472 RepID=A0ABY8XP89_9PSEU|nr:hypothetical protein [Amycolatopsis sp. 2-2]WIV57441.1 hypothetical protein QP939_01740 [Amycolatopsis sp. 2-2]